LIHTVVDKIIRFAGEAHLFAMRQVTSMGKGHTHYRIAVLNCSVVGGHIRLSAGVWLDVSMVSMIEGLSPLNGQPFNNIHVLTAAVVTLTRIAFRILTGEERPQGFQHRRAGIVLRGDEVNGLSLSFGFLLDGSVYLRSVWLNAVIVTPVLRT